MFVHLVKNRKAIVVKGYNDSNLQQNAIITWSSNFQDNRQFAVTFHVCECIGITLILLFFYVSAYNFAKPVLNFIVLK